MGAYYGEEQVRRVRERVDLVQLVSEYTPVRKSGANFSCCCLFHQERTPSMYVYPADSSYHCFGCGAHGDAIRLLMERERLTFVESLENLARRAGIVLEPQGPGQTDHAAARQQRERQLKAVEFACRYYEQQLWSEAGGDALTYLRSRGLRDDCLKEFRIGWAPGHSTLVEEVERRGADPKVLVDIDLAVDRDGRLRDRFYERVTFPICDRLGNPLAFSARLLPAAEQKAKAEGRGVGKYINNTDTPLYHKGRIVFNLHRARTAVREDKRLVVMEGPTDVMAAWQAGITGCVAVLGTALTPDHARILGQAAAGADLTLLFDGDRAGQTNSLKAVKTCLAAGVAVKVAVLPDEMDPSELLTEGVDGHQAVDGGSRFNTVLASARDDLEHLLRATAPAPHAMKRADVLAVGRDLAAAIIAMPDAQARALARREAEAWLSIDLSLSAPPPPTSTPQLNAAHAAPESAEAASTAVPPPPLADVILHLLIRHPELRPLAADEHLLEPAMWPEPWSAVAAALLFSVDADAGTLRDLPEAQDPVVRQRLGWWLATGLAERRPPVEDPVQGLAKSARSLRGEHLKQQVKSMQAELAMAERDGDHGRAASLARETVALGRLIADLR